MKKQLFTLLLIGFQITFAQRSVSERPPVFEGCEELDIRATEICFYNKIQEFVFQNFQTPEELVKQNYKSNIIVLFEVSNTGNFKVLHINTSHQEINDEVNRVFSKLPKVSPPEYNGKPVYVKYTLRFSIPLKEPQPMSLELAEEKQPVFVKTKNKPLKELDSIVYHNFDNPQLKSQLNIPFSHSYYAQFDRAMNQVGANNHTAQKPYTYSEVAKYYDLEQSQKELYKNKEGWWGRKFWNENMVTIQGENYWFTMNPIVDLRVGEDTDSKKTTYNNTRALQIQGALGKQLHFSTTLYESQGRFADYYNQYAISIRPSGGNPAVIPGIGIAKEFKTDAFDFPSADANLTYSPNQFINLQLGYGRNFLGDGYRSLLQSDGTSPYPYFKINTTFWKIKYTNTYMWLKDLREEVTTDRAYATKYMANHYLSWNISNRFNLGVFESVVWTTSNDRGFDMNFVNPIIFYRTVEFNSSSKAGNALLGLTGKYKWNNEVNFYGQFLIDEFSVDAVKERNKSWKNKFGYQFGAKYYDAFGIDNLLLQAEYNIVRPYVYSHSDPITNYAHNNQSMGHQWGGNFKEFIFVARYFKGRYFADAKVTVGKRGLDFNTEDDDYNYGGNIYLDYEENRPYDTGVKVGQGNTTKVFIGDIQVGYLINPSTNLKVFANVIYRNFDPTAETTNTFKQNSTWFTIGVRADLFNWYFDY